MTNWPSTVDAVVVGAGTAGCLVALRLAAAGREVLLVEQGPGGLPGPEVTRLDRLGLNDAVRALAVPEAGGRRVVRGRGMGGSAAINGGYFVRADDADFQGWPTVSTSQWWTRERIVDGYSAVEELLEVSAFGDDELGDVPRAFERYWAGDPGLIRVRANRRAGHRTTAASMLAAGDGWRVVVAAGVHVDEVLMNGGRAVGVSVGGRTVFAGEVVVSAGTLGTAKLLRDSGIVSMLGLGGLGTNEHSERLVRFAPRVPVTAPALLQSVLHDDDGLEIRCYGDDFARFIPGVAASGIAVGVADLARPLRGRLDDAGLDLGMPSEDSCVALGWGVERVVRMLESPEFERLVVPGSVVVDPVVGISQHTYGTLPLGTMTDVLGAVSGIDGLRVVDGSLIPGPLSSGPHATIAMLAWVIGGALAG